MESTQGITQAEAEIVEEFALFDSWMDKYEHIIEMGKSLPPMDPALKTDDRLIKGCQSRVWLASSLTPLGMHFEADSDAIITKGIIALIVRVLENQPPSEVVKAPLAFIQAIGLQENLSPTRANGLLSMVKQIKLDAFALQSAPSSNA
jgi:cysteine desulfuration protein SufE